MIDKTNLGIPFFDQIFGGVFRNRPVLCWGPAGSGKSTLGLHFINQALSHGDRALLLSGRRAADTLIIAESFGMPLSKAVSSQQLTLLEYAALITNSAASSNIMLPPQAFVELQEIITSQSIRRVVLDPVVPWVAIQPTDRLTEHLFSFVRALDRLGATVLLTLPRPVSNSAFLLKNKLEDLCPVSLLLDQSAKNERHLQITKYLGAVPHLETTIPFRILSGKGLVPPATATGTAGPTPPTPPTPKSPSPTVAKRPISFSSAIRPRT